MTFFIYSLTSPLKDSDEVHSVRWSKEPKSPRQHRDLRNREARSRKMTQFIVL